jgi:hypothetical protein
MLISYNGQMALMVRTMMEEQTFEQWWDELRGLAKDAEWELGVKDTYMEFFDDGDSPADALEDDMENREPDE